jgi:hypothetical protein
LQLDPAPSAARLKRAVPGLDERTVQQSGAVPTHLDVHVPRRHRLPSPRIRRDALFGAAMALTLSGLTVAVGVLLTGVLVFSGSWSSFASGDHGEATLAAPRSHAGDPAERSRPRRDVAVTTTRRPGVAVVTPVRRRSVSSEPRRLRRRGSTRRAPTPPAQVKSQSSATPLPVASTTVQAAPAATPSLRRVKAPRPARSRGPRRHSQRDKSPKPQAALAPSSPRHADRPGRGDRGARHAPHQGVTGPPQTSGKRASSQSPIVRTKVALKWYVSR